MTTRIRLDELSSTESTNSFILDRPEYLVPGQVVFTLNQTRGRGRRGRDWVSPPGESLAMSLALNFPPIGVSASWIPLLAGACAAHVVRGLGVPNVCVKWPNDVLVGERKLAGVLTEVAHDGVVVVGLGINLEFKSHSPVIPGATSLGLCGVELSDVKEQFIRPWAYALLGFIDDCLYGAAGEVIKKWKSFAELRMETLGRQVEVCRSGTENLVGKAVALSGDGGLVIALRNGADITITAGDVFHISR